MGRFGRAQDFCEIARLDLEGEIEGQQQALIHHLQDGARRRIVVVGLAPVDRVGGRKRHHAGLGIDLSAGQAEPISVPRRLGLRVLLDPVLGGLDEIGRRHDRVDQLQRLGALDAQLVALEQELQRVRRGEHARDPRGAAGAREEPDLDLGQAEPGARILRRDAVVAREHELEGAAERGAVDRGGPGLSGRLQPAVELRELAAFLEQRGRGRLRALGLAEILKHAAEAFEQREIGAAREGVLARRDDRALDGGIGGDLLDDRRELLDHLEVDDVHRAPGTVPGDERDAVAVDLELEMLEGHRVLALSSLLSRVRGTTKNLPLIFTSPGRVRRICAHSAGSCRRAPPACRCRDSWRPRAARGCRSRDRRRRGCCG